MYDEVLRDVEANLGGIIRALVKGDRVELIPVKGGVKVMLIRRDELRRGGK